MKDPLTLLNALRTFEAVAKLGSIKDAALELGVTDGAVSKQLKYLESVLDVELVHRGQRNLRLTDDAVEYANSLRFAFQTIIRATDKLVGKKTGDSLVIAAPGTFLIRWLMPRLDSLQSVIPNTRINVVTWNKNMTASDRSIDLFIDVGELPQIQGMESRALRGERFGPVISVDLWQADNTAERIFDFRLLCTEWPALMWQNWAAEANVILQSTDFVEYERLFYAIQAAEAGQGVALAPEPGVLDALEAGTLIAPFGMHTRPGHWHVSWRSDSWNHTKNIACKWLANELADS